MIIWQILYLISIISIYIIYFGIYQTKYKIKKINKLKDDIIQSKNYILRNKFIHLDYTTYIYNISGLILIKLKEKKHTYCSDERYYREYDFYIFNKKYKLLTFLLDYNDIKYLFNIIQNNWR